MFEYLAEVFLKTGFQSLANVVQGLGYAILRYGLQVDRGKELDPDGWPVILAGIVGWTFIVILLIVVWKQF